MENRYITKLEHSSVLIEVGGKRILFDPGTFTTPNDTLNDIDILLITHSHGDHLNHDNINYIIEKNKDVLIITNTQVADLLNDIGVQVKVVEGSEQIHFEGISITAHDHLHEEIYKDFGRVQNTGYYVDDLFFHPGDAFTKPNREVAMIATVISAPFMAVKRAINYINDNPAPIHLGVHDGVITTQTAGWLMNIIENNIHQNCRYQHPEIGMRTTV